MDGHTQLIEAAQRDKAHSLPLVRGFLKVITEKLGVEEWFPKSWRSRGKEEEGLKSSFRTGFSQYNSWLQTTTIQVKNLDKGHRKFLSKRNAKCRHVLSGLIFF